MGQRIEQRIGTDLAADGADGAANAATDRNGLSSGWGGWGNGFSGGCGQQTGYPFHLFAHPLPCFSPLAGKW